MNSSKVLILIPGSLNDVRVWEAQAAGLAAHADIRIADITAQTTTAAMAEAVLSRNIPIVETTPVLADRTGAARPSRTFGAASGTIACVRNCVPSVFCGMVSSAGV